MSKKSHEIYRTTYLYDEANHLIEEAEEGQTHTKYILKNQELHLHRVQWEEKRDWEGQLIHKIYFTYEDYGNHCKEEHFRSDGNLAYTIRRNSI